MSIFVRVDGTPDSFAALFVPAYGKRVSSKGRATSAHPNKAKPVRQTIPVRATREKTELPNTKKDSLEIPTAPAVRTM